MTQKFEYAGVNYDCYLKYVKNRSGRKSPRVYCRSIKKAEKPPDWQMTKEEFANHLRQQMIEDLEELVREGMVEREKKNWGESLVEKHLNILKSQSGTQGIKMKLHKDAVRNALIEEKSVPPRVLDEYPDLKKELETGELWFRKK